MNSETPDKIERVIEIDAPIERVWTAITAPDEVNQWFGDRCRYEVRPGAEGVLQWGEDAFRMQVVDVEPPHRFSYRWVPSREDDHSDPFDDATVTLVEFTLEPTANGTRLSLVESGFASHPIDVRAGNYADNTRGWTNELGELVAYLQGAPVGSQ